MYVNNIFSFYIKISLSSVKNRIGGVRAHSKGSPEKKIEKTKKESTKKNPGKDL